MHSNDTGSEARKYERQIVKGKQERARSAVLDDARRLVRSARWQKMNRHRAHVAGIALAVHKRRQRCHQSTENCKKLRSAEQTVLPQGRPISLARAWARRPEGVPAAGSNGEPKAGQEE